MPNQSTVPTLGTKCGRRERKSRRGGRGERSPRKTGSFACRDGGRHPGSLKGGALRGASPEGRPRSVRRPRAVPPRRGRRAGDSGCPEGAEEGNVVGMRHQAHAPDRTHELSRMRSGDASFARSFDPCASIPTMHPAKAWWWGVRAGITVGQPRETEKNQHWGLFGRTLRGSPRAAALAREQGVARQKRKEVEASVPARIASSGLVARTS
jgi:hypothetical protein